MAATFVVMYLPVGLADLVVKLTPAGSEPAADPAGYAAVDTDSVGLYRVTVPPYLSQQPAGKYWCRLFLPDRVQPALADWVELVDGSSTVIGELPVVTVPVPVDPEIVTALELARADAYIDSRQVPWREVRIKRGSGDLETGEVLLVRELFTIGNAPINKINDFVAISKAPAPGGPGGAEDSIQAENGDNLLTEAGDYLEYDLSTPPGPSVSDNILTEVGNMLTTEAGDLLFTD